jgi:hypothetical protein
MSADADQFRKQAKEKTFWLRLAEDWLKLAKEADNPTKRR